MNKKSLSLFIITFCFLFYSNYLLAKSKKPAFEAAKANAIQSVIDNSFDKRKVYDAVYVSSEAFQYADISLKKDKDFVISILLQDGRLWLEIDDSLKTDPDVLQAVIQELRLALYSGIYNDREREKRFQTNKQLLATILDGYISSEKDEAKKVQKIKKIALDAVRKNGNALMYFDDFTGDEDVVLAAVSKNVSAFEYIDYEFSSNKKVMMAVVSRDGFLLEEADEILRNDKEVVLAAVKETGNAFEYASDVLKKDRRFVLAATKLNGYSFLFADSSLK